MNNPPVISMNKITKRYAKRTVLDNLDWQVQSGDVVALLGKNGAGKSTLLEGIMGLKDINSGDMEYWGKPWDELPESDRQKIAFVPQKCFGYEWMKVKDFLSYLGSFFPSWNAEYCYSLMDRWGLKPNQAVKELSSGQTQIMHGILAISTKPELLILDEPVAHLDPHLRRQFVGELVELGIEKNATVIFSSHIISDLERVATKIALLQEGAITRVHNVDELKLDIAHVKIFSNKPLEQTEEFVELSDWKIQPAGATAKILAPLKNSLDSIREKTKIKIETTPLSLEDWYLEVSHASV